MAIRNFQVFGSFDQTNPIWTTQADIFNAVVQLCLRQLSGVDVTCVSRGSVRTAGGVQAVLKCQARVPKGGDEALAGARVGLAATSEMFKTCVDGQLLDQSGGASALIELTTTLDRAIVNDPPGLVTQNPPPPPAVQLNLVPGARGSYNIVLDAALAAGTTAQTTFLMDPFIANVGPDVFYLANFSMLKARSFPVAALPGDWDVETTWPVTANAVGKTYVTTTKSNPQTAEITKDGTPVGSVNSILPQDISYGIQHSMLSNPIQSNFWADAILATGNAAGTSLGQLAKNVIDPETSPLSMQQSSTVLKIVDSANSYNAGDVLGIMFVFAAAVIDL